MNPYHSEEHFALYLGDTLDVLRELPDASVDCCVTSPPYYGLRDYGTEGQYGLESSPAEYVERMRQVFAEVRRVLADDGTLWLNIGDSYAVRWGSTRRKGRRGYAHEADRGRSGAIPHEVPEKNLLGIPWRVAFALQDDGWTLRNDIIWSKPNAMPESVTDRLSTRHEHVFLFSKSRRYWFDLDPIREQSLDRGQAPTWEQRKAAGEAMRAGLHGMAPTHSGAGVGAHPSGRNPGDVWTIPTQPFAAAHFAVMAPALAARCIAAGCKPGGVVLDPFSGSGTTGMVALRHDRRYVGIDISAEYLDLSLETRFSQAGLVFDEEPA